MNKRIDTFSTFLKINFLHPDWFWLSVFIKQYLFHGCKYFKIENLMNAKRLASRLTIS